MYALDLIVKDGAEEREKLKFIEALFEVKKWIGENLEPFEPDWGDDKQGKYTIIYDNCNKTFSAVSTYDWVSLDLLPHLKSKDDCLNLISAQEPNLKIIFGIKE
jgi:hypothetical protein